VLPFKRNLGILAVVYTQSYHHVDSARVQASSGQL